MCKICQEEEACCPFEGDHQRADCSARLYIAPLTHSKAASLASNSWTILLHRDVRFSPAAWILGHCCVQYWELLIMNESKDSYSLNPALEAVAWFQNNE